MNWPDLYLALASGGLYIIAIACLGLDATFQKPLVRRLALALTAAGFVVHTAALVTRVAYAKDMPFTDLFEYTLFMSWAIVLAYLVFFRRRLPRVGAIVLLVIVFVMIGASFFYYTGPGGGKMPALRSYWLYIHVSLAALGETFFAVGFVASLIYLGRRAAGGTPDSLASLEDLAYRAITIGFPLFTAGALAAGAIWAKRAWGAYWSWDPKEVLSLVVWLVYAAYLHARQVRGLRGPAAAGLSIAGFLLTLFTIFSTLVFGGLHAYG
ncbi:MAG TPA: cytochrome c biogenesis protein CcsA [bacterium]|nr:cytochrome c biogenesis protein CcsA [bacterium]